MDEKENENPYEPPRTRDEKSGSIFEMAPWEALDEKPDTEPEDGCGLTGIYITCIILGLPIFLVAVLALLAIPSANYTSSGLLSVFLMQPYVLAYILVVFRQKSGFWLMLPTCGTCMIHGGAVLLGTLTAEYEGGLQAIFLGFIILLGVNSTIMFILSCMWLRMHYKSTDS